MGKAKTFDLADGQGDAMEAKEITARVVEALDCAECCESAADFRTNAVDALDAARELVKALTALVEASNA